MTARCRFLLVITGRNAGEYIEALLGSLAAQTHADWRAVFVDDASDDGTRETLAEALERHVLTDRIVVRANEQRRYKARNVHCVMREEAKRDEIVVMLDADDRLADPSALETLAKEYGDGWDVVWSNWRGSDGSPGKSDSLCPWLSPRFQPFVTQHLFSFRASLYETVEERDLQDDEGAWFRAGCDLAVAWPVLERTRRRRFVDRVLCVYNTGNPLSHKASGGKAAQMTTIATLRRRAAARPPFDLGFVAAHFTSYLRDAWRNARLIRRYIRHERRLRALAAGRPVH